MSTPIWKIDSWRTKYYYQEITYPAPRAAETITHKLTLAPPLVTAAEIITLKQALKQAALGESFLLQGGDCAERFSHNNALHAYNKVSVLKAMQTKLSNGLQVPTVPIGRIAGQYAKPRSAPYEIRDGQRLPSYVGDLINGANFNAVERTPDPERMLTGYHQATMTWQKIKELATPDNFYISHETLHLPYESALTRQHSDGAWYNLGTHFPWTGVLTAHLDSAHTEYLRGISNPIAIKVGPMMSLLELKQLIELLNPDNELGRLTLIHRFGTHLINKKLPAFIELIKKHQFNIVWMVDPMHGNTQLTATGYKTRYFEDILQEVHHAFQIHHAYNTQLSGIHLELAGEDVAECIGGPTNVNEKDIAQGYKSLVDPRLNNAQALAIADYIGELRAAKQRSVLANTY